MHFINLFSIYLNKCNIFKYILFYNILYYYIILLYFCDKIELIVKIV